MRKTIWGRRMMSIVLSFAMTVSLIPAQTLASEDASGVEEAVVESVAEELTEPDASVWLTEVTDSAADGGQAEEAWLEDAGMAEDGTDGEAVSEEDEWVLTDDTEQETVEKAVMEAVAEEKPVTANVSFTAQAYGGFLFAPQKNVTVSSDLAESYGYADQVPVSEAVSALDVLVKAHELALADSFTKEDCTVFLALNEGGWCDAAFGESGTYGAPFGYVVNGDVPGNGNYTVNQASVKTGDFVEFMLYQDATGWSDHYVWFDENRTQRTPLEAAAQEELTVQLKGISLANMYYDVTPVNIAGAQLALVDENGGISDIEGAVTDENGQAKFILPEAGEYLLTAYTGEGSTPCFLPLQEVTAAAAPSLNGAGTENDPYTIASGEDMALLGRLVNEGDSFEGKYIKLRSDITLPAEWTPLGSKTVRFKGTIDGDWHLLTVPEGGKCLLGCTENAVLKNLNIYGRRIASAGVLETYTTGSSKPCLTCENVTIKSGTETLCSGFAGGYASGSHTITLRGCTVESGVVIGYDKSQSNIGSFGGDFNGTIENCTSAATVYGVNFVGGICGNKGQSMSTYSIQSCTFTGAVVASGMYAGGISGAGYGGTTWGITSAPNAGIATIQNCEVTGSVTGADHVGGILGSEPGVVQCWVNGAGSISGNIFRGSVKATAGTNVGAIAGYYHSLNKYTQIENNWYADSSLKVIGGAAYVDTSCENPAAAEGVTYFNSETNKPSIKGASKTGHNRTDDPLGADAMQLADWLPGAEGTITVKFAMFGDDVHDGTAVHTQKSGGLTTWIAEGSYTVANDATVKDVAEKALAKNGMKWVNESGAYISSVTNGAVTLGEKTNGENSGWMYMLNGKYSDYSIAEQKAAEGDVVVFHYTDDYKKEEHEHFWDDGVETKKASCTETGKKTYHCLICGETKTEETAKTGHTFGVWETTAEASVLTPEQQKRVCSVCKTEETRAFGEPLQGKLKVSTTYLPLKKSQKLTKFKATDFANGDSVESWTSSNPKIVTVTGKPDGTCVIRAKKKTGTAKITIKMVSGVSKTIRVKVQKAAVKTKKIKEVPSKQTIRKGETFQLKPEITPISSCQKITFKSLNSKVAKVSSKGVVRGVKRGKATIVVKSGKKTVKCKVTVTK